MGAYVPDLEAFLPGPLTISVEPLFTISTLYPEGSTCVRAGASVGRGDRTFQRKSVSKLPLSEPELQSSSLQCPCSNDRKQCRERDFWNNEDVSDTRLEVQLLRLALDREGCTLPADCMRECPGPARARGEGCRVDAHAHVHRGLAHEM